MTHGDLYVRMPSRSSDALFFFFFFGLKKEQLGRQFGSVHADISDRELEQGDREKNIGIHNDWESAGGPSRMTRGMFKRVRRIFR